MQISRIRLSDKTSRLRSRRDTPKRTGVRVQRTRRGARVDPSRTCATCLGLLRHHRRTRVKVDPVDRPVCATERADFEVVRPAAQGAVQRAHPFVVCQFAEPSPRGDNRLASSLSRATPPAASERLSELLGCPISTSSPRLASVLNQGPFPPPALPGFVGTTSLSVTLRRPALPSRASG